ncbi:NAD(P)-dependent alcohol dehydrogenase [Halosolutus gelatinilyticus]|uniref:NAD(P)-dependent alcohol dehydrogenase n=1 Tax=Halosolutus gelatinilyticus TaxID=2931975 RepID=UPI001FF25255|nr:NAD(P)-dependent alcohol dehydrogenase [Halosolutus gelatinilyticus]
MNAVVYSEYGGPDVLEPSTVAKPTPGDDEVLIAVRAASVNAGDWHLMRGSPFPVRFMYGGVRTPERRILGMDVAGRVEAVGNAVTRFRPGDEVFGDVSRSDFGGFAEYVAAPEEAVIEKPADRSFEEVAAVPTAAVTALQGLRDNGRIRSGHAVLIIGASGGVGTFAVQIADSYGADVTGVCRTDKTDLVRSIGADRVIDYTREDVIEDGQSYDLIFDAAAPHSIVAYRRALTPGGSYVMVGGPFGRLLQAVILGPVISMAGEKTLGNLYMEPSATDLAAVKELLEAGAVSPVIDRRYPLAEVPDAVRYLEAGHATGKVVITVGGDGPETASG